MRPEKISTDALFNCLNDKKIASMSELKEVLGTDADKTVFRKLRKLSYRSSYSHRGKYCTLDEVACFDKLGLWSYGTVRFSGYGTLSDTVRHFVGNSEAGHSARELDRILCVRTGDALLNLCEKKLYAVKKSRPSFFTLQ